ncbi:MAG: hypothetical protein JETT_0515 [Candidatus Jettenia ecosi]|uniref:Uncharacterized protein n=1 Tax=Candidatus Jettenia ecosi TaxID=2494326 RepID=A0A533QKB3_9BACT|nr:MAG: hypothetical protein JETT_0515 [Candidatus Jettenia ecosi]
MDMKNRDMLYRHLCCKPYLLIIMIKNERSCLNHAVIIMAIRLP